MRSWRSLDHLFSGKMMLRTVRLILSSGLARPGRHRSRQLKGLAASRGFRAAFGARTVAASTGDRAHPPSNHGATEKGRTPGCMPVPTAGRQPTFRNAGRPPVRHAPNYPLFMPDAHGRIRTAGGHRSGSHCSATTGSIAHIGKCTAATDRPLPARGRQTDQSKRGSWTQTRSNFAATMDFRLIATNAVCGVDTMGLHRSAANAAASGTAMNPTGAQAPNTWRIKCPERK